MTQIDFGTINPNTKSGTALASDLNDWRDTVHSQHLGASAPTYITAGQLWSDNTSANYITRQYDGTDHIPVWQLDATNNVTRVALDADADTYIVSGVAADDTISAYLAATESLRFNATGLRLGAGAAAVGLDLQDKTDALRNPSGTTAQRPGTPANGDQRYNTTTSDMEFRIAGSWTNFVTATGTQTLTSKTLTAPILQDGLTIDTNPLSWAGTEDLDPANGLYQEVTLTADVTTLTDSLADGESIIMEVDDGTGPYGITWPTITWVSDAGTAPSLQTTAKTLITVWKSDTTLFGFASNGA